MWESIAIILIILWLLGLVSSHTLGGYLHLLLLVAILAMVIRLVGGRKPLK